MLMQIKHQIYLAAFLLLLSSSIASDVIPVAVTVNFLDSEIMDFEFCGPDNNIIFFISKDYTLYVTHDEGLTVDDVTTHLKDLAVKQAPQYDPSLESTVQKILKSPADNSTLLFQGHDIVNWVTEDCGQTYQALNHGRKIEEFQFHPTKKEWILAKAQTLCSDFVNEPCLKYMGLFMSTELSKSWSQLATHVTNFSWGRPDATSKMIPESRVIIAYEPNATKKNQVIGYNPNLVLAYSDDYFKSSIQLVENSLVEFHMSQNFIVATLMKDQTTNEIQVKTTSAKRDVYHLREIVIPIDALYAGEFEILNDIHSENIFVRISGQDDFNLFSNVYQSDSVGVNFQLRGKYVVENPESKLPEFDKIDGIDGVYVQNFYDSSAFNDLISRPVQQDWFARSYTEVLTEELQDFEQTKISHDGGHTWKKIAPPQAESHHCKNCSLNFKSITGTYFHSAVYSSQYVPGLLIANGNVGVHLDQTDGLSSTYASMDGGYSWYEIADEQSIFEIGNHGSTILTVQQDKLTQYASISIDFGKTQQQIQILSGFKNQAYFEKIVQLKNSTTEKFLIYGYSDLLLQKNSGIIVQIEIPKGAIKECSLQQHPGMAESDFEIWRPDYGNGKDSCVLGKQVSYIRKKESSVCIIDSFGTNFKVYKNCKCTEQDWECDYNFFRMDGQDDGPCISEITNMPADPAYQQPPSNCDGTYMATQGYRKKFGDTCEGGVDHSYVERQCPKESGWSFFGTLFKIIVVGGIGYGCFLLFKKMKERQDEADRHERDVLGDDGNELQTHSKELISDSMYGKIEDVKEEVKQDEESGKK